MTKNRFKKIAKKISKSVSEEIIIMFGTWEPYGHFSTRFFGSPMHPKYISSWALRQSVKRLKKRGLLEEKKVEDQVYYRLSREGRLQSKMLHFQLSPKEKSNKSTIIIFDIPESKSNFRHFLRRFLLRNGFILLQESVFVTGNQLSADFFGILRDMNLLEYISIIEGKIMHRLS